MMTWVGGYGVRAPVSAKARGYEDGDLRLVRLVARQRGYDFDELAHNARRLQCGVYYP